MTLSEISDKVTHSTGHPERLNRPFGSCYGDADYIREELVAELTAALCGAMLGFATTPRQENAAYLASWLRGLKEKPEYLFDILIDANKAATMIADRVEESNAKPDETAA